ncbi:alpha/beta-hydrolase [Ramaria rubella]|nr:alpha/beta-hydrolase [Ramaria rubella]
MHLKTFLLLVTTLTVVASLPIEKRSVSEATFNDLDTFMKYASSAYSAVCPSPLGNTLVTTFNDAVTSTQAFLARDDTNKLLIVALRGSQQIEDFIIDANIELIPFISPGVNAPGATVHGGFLTAYNSIASQVVAAVNAQLAGPAAGYSLRTAGHSLGGALSSIAAVSLKSNFPTVPIQMYTYGQPRTGNAAYATLVNGMFGTDAFRSVHTTDGVPTIIPQTLGYRHHAFEYWQNPDPASAATVKMCDASGEDPTCSDGIPSGGIDAAHLTYFNRIADAPFCT